MFLQIFKICSLSLILASLCGCLTLEESALKRSPDEIFNWSDEYLCQNAYWKNPSIKTELINRKLLSTEEYDLLYVRDEIRNFPQVKMPKCAMWTYATDSKLIKTQPLEDGVNELWRIEKGEKFLFFFGGHKFWLTFVNNRITKIVPNQ